MKKILSIITAFALVGPSVLSVVSCGPKISQNVILLLPGMSMSVKSQITAAYQAIAQEFNESEEMKDSVVKIEATWEEGDPINRRLNSREQLPDLYIAYPDVSANYAYNYNTASVVRNMEESYYGPEGPKDDSPKLKDLFWSENFYNEGQIKDGLYSLALTKSFDMSVVNLKLFLELVHIVNPEAAVKIQAGLKAAGFSGNKAELFDDKSSLVELTSEAVNALRPKFDDLANDPENLIVNIREFFKYDDNIYYLSVIYNDFFIKEAFGKDAQYASDKRKMYSVGIDSMANKVITEYIDALEIQQAVDPTTQGNDNFLYQVDLDPYNEKMTVTLDNADSEIFQQVATYFDKMTELAKRNGKSKDGDPEIRWGGSLFSKFGGKYATNYFAEGTMLLSSGSSAGTWAYPIKNTNIYDFRKDLLTVSDATASGNFYNFVQQGPSLSGFKSVGSNAVEKEQVVTKFINYLLKPKVLNHFAILSGYIPSTTEALNIFQHYKNGNYNNETGTWKAGVELPSNANDFEKIAEVNGNNFGKYLTQDDLVIDQLLSFALNPLLETQAMDVVSTKANPAGKIIRDSIEEVLNNYIFKDFLKFSQLLKDNGREKGTVKGQLYNKFPTGFTYSEVKVKA